MHKLTVSLLALIFMAGMFTSCRKSLPFSSSGDGPAEGPVPEIIETEPPVLTPVKGKISPNILAYYAALPARYNESSKKYPVIIFFPGGGQYGNGSNIDTVLADGIPRLIRDKKFPPSFTVESGTYSFIVITPQLVRKINNDEIDALLDSVKARYRIDASRIYISGFSLGGRQACDYAAYKPREVAALTAMAGMPQMISTLTDKCKAIADANLPVWQFHNKDDSAWRYTESVKFITTLNDLNPAIPGILTLFDVGVARLHHDCWTKACDPEYRENGKNIYEWMLGYSR